MLNRIERLLDATMQFILQHPLIFWSCVVANLIGALFGGALWYGPMLLWSPPWAWPFIPDCPLASLLGAIGLLGLRARQQWGFFYALAAFACMKYGLWTVAFWWREWSLAGTAYPLEVMLFITHIGLLIEGLLFVLYIGPLSLLKRAGVIAWFVLSVYVDYGLGFHPPLGEEYGSFVTATFAALLAGGLTALLAMGLLVLPYQAEAPAQGIARSTGMGLADEQKQYHHS